MKKFNLKSYKKVQHNSYKILHCHECEIEILR